MSKKLDQNLIENYENILSQHKMRQKEKNKPVENDSLLFQIINQARIKNDNESWYMVGKATGLAHSELYSWSKGKYKQGFSEYKIEILLKYFEIKFY